MKVSNLILIGGIALIAASTVPTQADFHAFSKDKIQSILSTEICTDARTLDNSLKNSICHGVLDNIVVPMTLEMFKQSSTYENYGVFSRFIVEGSNRTEIVVVGAFNNFWITKNNIEFNMHNMPTQDQSIPQDQTPTLSHDINFTPPTPHPYEVAEHDNRVSEVFFNEALAYQQWAKDFITYYYEMINSRKYFESWSSLSPDFQSTLTYTKYTQFWDTIANVNVEGIEIMSISKHLVIAKVNIIYTKINGEIFNDTTPYIYLIVDSNNNWSFDKKIKHL